MAEHEFISFALNSNTKISFHLAINVCLPVQFRTHLIETVSRRFHVMPCRGNVRHGLLQQNDMT